MRVGLLLVFSILMPIATVISFILLSFPLTKLLNFQPDYLQWAHQACLNFAPESSYQELYRAIVCGSRVDNPTYQQLFRDSGLIHILVVSGSHLLMLKNWVRTRWLQLPILALYCWTTGLQPPVVRAFVQVILKVLVDRFALQWSPTNLIFMSGLVTWSLNPLWIKSMSFQLSWICALGLSLTVGQSLLIRSLALYLGTSLLLAQFHWPHPISILMNALVAPVIGGLLFPLSLLAFALPAITFVTDPFWKVVLFLCRIATEGNLMFPSVIIDSLEIWILIWFLHIAAHLKSVSKFYS